MNNPPLRPVDNLDDARDIMTFWDRGTASGFETKLIELFLQADAHHRARLALIYPVMAVAIAEWERGRK